MQEVNTYLDISGKLAQPLPFEEKKRYGSGLVALLSSKDSGMSMKAKFKLRAHFAPEEGLPTEFASEMGPASVTEILYWENYFKDYLMQQ